MARHFFLVSQAKPTQIKETNPNHPSLPNRNTPSLAFCFVCFFFCHFFFNQYWRVWRVDQLSQREIYGDLLFFLHLHLLLLLLLECPENLGVSFSSIVFLFPLSFSLSLSLSLDLFTVSAIGLAEDDVVLELGQDEEGGHAGEDAGVLQAEHLQRFGHRHAAGLFGRLVHFGHHVDQRDVQKLQKEIRASVTANNKQVTISGKQVYQQQGSKRAIRMEKRRRKQYISIERKSKSIAKSIKTTCHPLDRLLASKKTARTHKKTRQAERQQRKKERNSPFRRPGRRCKTRPRTRRGRCRRPGPGNTCRLTESCRAAPDASSYRRSAAPRNPLWMQSIKKSWTGPLKTVGIMSTECPRVWSPRLVWPRIPLGRKQLVWKWDRARGAAPRRWRPRRWTCRWWWTRWRRRRGSGRRWSCGSRRQRWSSRPPSAPPSHRSWSAPCPHGCGSSAASTLARSSPAHQHRPH